MKTKNILNKLFASIVNVILTFILSLPFFFLYGNTQKWKVGWIFIFFIYNLVLYRKCPGMVLVKTHYEKQRTLPQVIFYTILYTLSFSTLIFYIWFPFDLLIFNLLVLQLPSILLTGNTLHGLLSGNIKTLIN